MPKQGFHFIINTPSRLAKHIIIMATRLNDINGDTTVPDVVEQNGDDNTAEETLCPICQDPIGTHGGIIECCPSKHQMCNTCAQKYLINKTTQYKTIQNRVECPYKCGHDVAARIKETLPHLTTITETLYYFDLLPGESNTGYTVEMKIRWNHMHEHDVLYDSKELYNFVAFRSLMPDVCGFMKSDEETKEKTRMDFTHVICKDKLEQGWTSGKKGMLVKTFDHYNDTANEPELNKVYFEIKGNSSDHEIVFYQVDGEMRVVESLLDDSDVQLRKRVRRD